MWSAVMSAEDHPRGCGEENTLRQAFQLQKGSSPRVRGRVAFLEVSMVSRGIIPAGAGKRIAAIAATVAGRDHPRGCGEEPLWTLWVIKGQGSSPRVRGRDSTRRHTRFRQGIIPAGAGKRSGRTTSMARRRDHPRGCGEELPALRISPPGEGSSPRVRGRVYGKHADRERYRIIPAGAGKSFAVRALPASSRDHPRGCGEEEVVVSPLYAEPGSSPRVRGRGIGRIVRWRIVGIIPAGAGKRIGCQSPDHGI